MINVCVGLILLSFMRRPSVVHLHWCGVAICYGTAGLLIGFRDFLPVWLANVIANMLVGLSVVLIHRGTWIMIGKRPPDRIYAASLAALGAVYYQFNYPTPDVGMRLLAVSMFRVPYFVGTAIALRSTPPFRDLCGTRSLFWLLTIGAGWYFFRGSLSLSSEAWAVQMRVGTMQSINFLIASVVNVMITVTLFRLEAEQALRYASDLAVQLQNQLTFQKSLIEAIPVAVFFKNEYGTYLGCNQKFADITGRPQNQIAGHTLDDLFPEAVTAEAIQSDHRVYQTRKPHSYDFVKRWGNESEQHLRTYKAPFDRADGSLGGLIGIILDISSDMQREESLRQAKLAAEQASQAKSNFLAMMSHELRTPMTGVIGMADFLAETALNQDQRSYVDTLRSSAKMLLTILNDILDYSKIDADRLTLHSIAFDAVTLAAETMRLFWPKAEENANSIELDVGGLDTIPVKGDPTRIKQVLGNLISNAVKFTKAGKVVICLRRHDRDGRVCLEFVIEDTGIGIAETDMKLLFLPFSQTDVGATRQFGGTGLGLAISKRLVELMGGEICASSQPGRGSRFRFTCLVDCASPDDLVSEPHTATPVCPMNILVAEDNPINRMILKVGIESRHHRVTMVENGVQASEIAANQQFDLILMDIQMPVMDGTEATRRIRKLPKPFSDVPIVALTADALTEHREAYMQTGLTDFLTKPIEWKKVDNILARYGITPAASSH